MSQVSVARFKFEAFILEYGSGCENVVDGRGTKWQLDFVGFEHDLDSELYNSGNFYFCMSPKCIQHTKTPSVITAQVTLAVRNQSGDIVYEYNIPTKTYGSEVDDVGYIVHKKDFSNWSDVKKMLVRGNLIVDAIVQYHQEEKDCLYVPANPFGQNMLKLLENNQYADVMFRVGDSQELFPAHRLILNMNAPALANFCSEPLNNKPTINIKDTNPRVFRYVLRYIYGGSAPSNDEMVEFGKDIIDACDLFDVVGLKIAAETTLVQNCVINVNNVAEWIQYADAKTCPLLKEYALSYFAACARDVLKTESYKNMRECPRLLEEVMIAVQNASGLDVRFKRATILSVNELRTKLSSIGLDVDGSKETLVARLNDSMENSLDNAVLGVIKTLGGEQYMACIDATYLLFDAF